MDIKKQFDHVTSPDISNTISEGLSQIYHNKPLFPVTYLAKWLKSHSASQKRKAELMNTKDQKEQRYKQVQVLKQKLLQQEKIQKEKREKQIQEKNQVFQGKIVQTKHLQDLLYEWLPEFIQKTYQLTGAYVGKLDFNKKAIEEGNFQLGAENDTDNPKVITYVGSSISQKSLMVGNTLPVGKGISYDIFQEKTEEANQQANQQINAEQKKSYLYINNVLRQQRLHYFKYPRLGAYACYPLKIRSCLNISTLDKGVVDYKAYLKAKEQAEKEYNEKVSEAKSEAEEASKKVEDFQINDQDPSSHQQKKNLEAEAAAAQQKLQQLLRTPPVIEQVQFETIQKNFFLAADTLGQDRQISDQVLSVIDSKTRFFIDQWEGKEKKMLLTDILTFLQEEPQLESIEILLSEHQKGILTSYEAQIKEQFANREKQAEFELCLIKCQKTRQLLQEQTLKNSMEVYLNYNVPKFTELIQIWCLLLGFPKKEINLPQSNQLDHRKIINPESFKNLLSKLEKYELRRQSSESVSSDYKINKLLERVQKIQGEALAKYNGFMFVLHSMLKNYCWAKILCRDAKKELFESKTRQKEDRDNQIQKWLAQIEKNLQTAKAQLDEQGQQNFKQEDWRKNYEQQNPRPQPLEAPVPKEFLDIQ